MVKGEEACEALERLRLVEGVLKWKQRVLCMLLGALYATWGKKNIKKMLE